MLSFVNDPEGFVEEAAPPIVLCVDQTTTVPEISKSKTVSGMCLAAGKIEFSNNSPCTGGRYAGAVDTLPPPGFRRAQIRVFNEETWA